MKRVLMFAALMMWSAASLAVVYKWTDAQGKTQYGDRPPDGVHAEIVELYGTRAARAAAPPSASARPSASVTPASASTPVADKEKKAVDADVAAAREKQCADAQIRYKQVIEGRRLYKLGENGERQYLTSEEIDAERLNAKRDLDAVCGDSQ